MPRRNRHQPRKSNAATRTPSEEARVHGFEQMARELVLRGLASPRILDRPHWFVTTHLATPDERNY